MRILLFSILVFSVIGILIIPNAFAQDSEIPAWIKNNAGWWATDQIDDSSFLQGIQYLIKEGIMVIPPTETSSSSGSEELPPWIKNNAGWWADGQIDDGSFVSGIQWLVSNGRIVIEQEESTPSGSDIDLVYQTEVVSKTPHTVALIYSTQNDTCSADEKEKAKAYGIMAEYLVSKNSRSNPTQVTAYCMKLDEISVRTFPYVMKQIETQMPKLLIYVGGLEADLETYDDESYVWWRSCNKTSSGECAPNQIIVCDNCKRWGVHMPDFEDVMDNGMWRLSAVIGGTNFYEVFGDRWDNEAYNYASRTSINENQEAFDLCHEFDILENKSCSKLYEEVTVLGEPYLVMDINYAKNNWRDEQKEVKKEIIKLVGTGSKFEGFSKFTLREVVKGSENTLDIETNDILTIEYPDDWTQEYYKYDWSISNATATDPDNTLECCHVFQADSATLRVYADLWKDDTRKEGPQYPWQYLASMSIWFLDNVHYGGTTDEERFDALVDSERKYCANAEYNKDQYICRNFKVLEKTIYATDEGRTAYSLLTTYDLAWTNDWGGKTTYIGTTTEVYVGEDAWQVWTEFDEDAYEYNRDVIDRFNSSLILLDNTEPIPSVPAITNTIVTEDGIQYKANRAWNDAPVWDVEQSAGVNATNITKYDMVCGADCNISLDENLEVGEVESRTWDGTDLEWEEYLNGKWTWDKIKEEWVETKTDKWKYETIDLKKFQDKKLHDKIWDIYHSMTPKQIMEDIDTFLISTDDSGGYAAFVMSCVDEEEWGCGPPDSHETKVVISFDPLNFAPTSGERQAYYQPGKLKDALETNMLKMILIHENAHILSLSPSQSSDNDLLGWEELLVDDDWDETNKSKAKQVFRQKEAACAPNHYQANAGCLKDNSYLNLFFQKFWADIYPEYHYWFEFADYKPANKSNYDFHQKYYDRFITYYSGSHPAEDFAEAFTVFVLWDEEAIANHKKWCTKEGWNLTAEKELAYWKWCGKIYRDNSIWEEKIRFFYDFPELVEMRDFIRSNL